MTASEIGGRQGANSQLFELSEAAVKLLLSAYKTNSAAAMTMAEELERMRADLLASNSSERELHAFNETADALLDVLRQN